MLNTDKNLKLYYSISEVAAMFDVNESLLRFWEKEFPQLNPKKGGRGIRQYRKEDIETVKLIYHLVKERGMTLPGARQRMKDNKEATIRNFEIVDRLRAIREELVGMKLALDEFTYEDVESLKENIQGLKYNKYHSVCSSTLVTCFIFCICFRLLQIVRTSSTSCT